MNTNFSATVIRFERRVDGEIASRKVISNSDFKHDQHISYSSSHIVGKCFIMAYWHIIVCNHPDH